MDECFESLRKAPFHEIAAVSRLIHCVIDLGFFCFFWNDGVMHTCWCDVEAVAFAFFRWHIRSVAFR